MDGSLFQAVGLAFGRRTGFDREGAIRTYSRRLFVISEKELESLAVEKERNERLGRFWRESTYSAREDHGTAADHSYIAGGIDLYAMLLTVGMTGDEADGRLLFAARNYKAVVDHPMTGRYYFGSDGCAEARTPLLAMESARLEEGGVCELFRRGSHPRLFFGQRTKDDANQCAFVRDLCCVQPDDMPPALDIYYGGRIWASPSLASLAAAQPEVRTAAAGGKRYLCFGTDLCALLARYGIGEGASAVVEYEGSRRSVIKDIHEGEFLLAWYSVSEADGAPAANSTDLKIYGKGVVFDGVSALRCLCSEGLRAALPQKTPSVSAKELLASTFYCAVESAGKRLVYYFSPEELRALYPVREMEYPYNDHEIEKKVQCRGVLLADIADSLCSEEGKKLSLPGEWKVQYLEEDGYHANTPTYIDSLAEVRGYKRPMLALEKRETFVFPDAYHHDDVSFSAPEIRCAYRAADSANESAVKGLMGAVIREEPAPISLPACRVLMYDADTGALIAEKVVSGALDGMRAVIQAPRLERYTALEPLSAMTTAAEGACVCFYYKEKPFVTFAGGSGGAVELFAGKMPGAETIPPSRESVATLALSGDAAVLTGRDGECGEPKRSLYIDERTFAGGTSPYGYGRYLLYRYEGWRLSDVARRLGIGGIRFRAYLAEGGAVDIEEPEECFVAFRRTESKGVPYNTAEYKRKAKEFRRPALISIYDGRVICSGVVKFAVEN